MHLIGSRGKAFVRLNPPLYNLLRFGKISKKQIKQLNDTAKRLIELDFWVNKGYKPWDIWRNYNRGLRVMGNLDRIDLMTMQGLRTLHDNDVARKQREYYRRQRARGGRGYNVRGTEASDPGSLQLSDFQREILSDKNNMRASQYRAKLFNSMFNE